MVSGLENKIEIKLTEANSEPVSLNSMAIDALESFMVVVSSLKSIAQTLVGREKVTFSFREGSAVFCVEAPLATLESIYSEMETAINGQSLDSEVTANLRRIQEQVKRKDFNYGFDFQKANLSIDICGQLVSAKRIRVKRARSKNFHFQLEIVSGVLNEIGGNDPNYHFDGPSESRITVDCSREEAIEVNQFLYQQVDALVLCKKWDIPEKKDEHYHRAIVEHAIARDFSSFLSTYNQENDLITRLGRMHDFVDSMFENSECGHKALRALLLGFNEMTFHQSELKTLLVISKPFKEHPLIRDARTALLGTYEKMRI